MVQIFSDSGTKLAPSLLGEKRHLYQERLARLWALTNNTPYSQFLNVAERKIMKQVISGLPGPQRVPINRDILAAVMLAPTNTVNNIPSLSLEGNVRLLAPGDSLVQQPPLGEGQP